MNVEEFKKSLSSLSPLPSLSPHLQSLWYDARGDWNKAHTIIQDLGDRNAAWIHAYLHRKEGDIANADYWYAKAGRKRPPASAGSEWEDIARALL